MIGQGKVEEILLSKPHERRRFVEEAAGLGKYQRRRARAETKMVRVASELERARDLEREVKARLRPLSIQATAADRAAKLAGEIAVGRVTLLSSEMLTEQRSSAGLDGRRAAAAQTHAAVEKKLEALAARRALAESELTGLAAAQERAAHSFYAFETARERSVSRPGEWPRGQRRWIAPGVGERPPPSGWPPTPLGSPRNRSRRLRPPTRLRWRSSGWVSVTWRPSVR